MIFVSSFVVFPRGTVGQRTAPITSSLNENLLAYWSFNSDTVDSIQSISGALSGTATLAAGKNGNAYSSPGGSSQMSFPTDALLATGTVSVSAWTKTDSAAGALNILSVDLQNYPYGWHGYSLNMNNGAYGFVVGLGANTGYTPNVDFGSVTSSTGNSDDQWHHVVGTYDGTNVKIYVDSVLQETASFNGALINYGSEIYGRIGAAQVKIFGGLNDYYSPFKGLIDEVAIWNSALTQQLVNELYNSGAGKYYPF